MRTSAHSLASELWSKELVFLKGLLRKACHGGKVLEIGTAAGGTLCEMMGCFDGAERPEFVVVDPMAYFPDQLDIVKRNLGEHGLDSGTVDFRIGTSNDTLAPALAAGERFDFMLIDGSHKIRYVTQDLGWLQLLNPGGIVCFHDYNDRHKGVTWSVDRFVRRHQNYRRGELVDSLQAVEKVSASNGAEVSRLDRFWSLVLSPCLQLEISIKKRLRSSSE
jgi:predicted O-methyltransferase YrrM